MDFSKFQKLWEDFLYFLDRTFQWLMYIFGALDNWPPEDYPNIDDEQTTTAE